MCPAYQGTKAGFRVKRIAYIPLFSMVADPLQQISFDLFMHEQARCRRTILPHIPKRAGHNMLGNAVKILGIIHHNSRVFAAHFQHNFLGIRLGSIGQKPFARFG